MVVGTELRLAGVLAREQPGRQRHPHDHADPAPRRLCEEHARRPLPERVEDDLHAGDVRVLHRLQRLLDAFDADAVGGDPALLDHRVEVLEDLRVVVEVGRRAVQLDQVERVDAEVLARPVVPGAEVLGRVVGHRLLQPPAHLGRGREPGPLSIRRPTSRSERPSPYTSAVSKKVTPASAAARSVSMAVSSSTLPQSAPTCQAPNPISETSRPVRPKVRLCMSRML